MFRQSRSSGAGVGGGRGSRNTWRTLLLTCIGTFGLAFLIVPPALESRPILLLNASASAPIGFYWVSVQRDFGRGDLVLAELPESMRGLADRRGYLPSGVKLVKRVAGVSGNHVCTIGRAILIEGKIAARRRKRDSEGRMLPHWQGCRRLRKDEFLLLMTDVRDSFDGRYFGPTRLEEIVGALTPLWTWQGDQR